MKYFAIVSYTRGAPEGIESANIIYDADSKEEVKRKVGMWILENDYHIMSLEIKTAKEYLA